MIFPILSPSILSAFPLFTWIRPPAHDLVKNIKWSIVTTKICFSILLQNAQTEVPADQINCIFSSMNIHS